MVCGGADRPYRNTNFRHDRLDRPLRGLSPRGENVASLGNNRRCLFFDFRKLHRPGFRGTAVQQLQAARGSENSRTHSGDGARQLDPLADFDIQLLAALGC